MRIRTSLACVAVLSLVAAGGCKKSDSTPSPAAPTVVRSTDTFTGSVPVGGSDVHNFTVGSTGQVDVTLTAAAPPSDVSMGIAVGLPGDAGCTPLAGASTNTSAGSSPQLSGTISTGTLCVRVSDNGSQKAAVSYTITVVHP
jgi:hypothetical protein